MILHQSYMSGLHVRIYRRLMLADQQSAALFER